MKQINIHTNKFSYFPECNSLIAWIDTIGQKMHPTMISIVISKVMQPACLIFLYSYTKDSLSFFSLSYARYYCLHSQHTGFIRVLFFYSFDVIHFRMHSSCTNRMLPVQLHRASIGFDQKQHILHLIYGGYCIYVIYVDEPIFSPYIK